MALQGFDKAYYLGQKLADLQATESEWIGKTTDFLETVLGNVYGLTAEEHYMQYGWQEGLAPNQYFNAEEYKLAKAQQLFDSGHYLTVESALAAFEDAWQQDPYQHYIQYGAGESINPSNAFDASQYFADKLAALQANPETADEWAGKTAEDVQNAFLDAGLTAIEHFMLYGKDEGLTITAVPAEEQVNPGESTPTTGEVFKLTTGTNTFTGTAGNDTFTADDGTFTAFDSLDGGAGTDSLTVTEIGAALTTAGKTVVNIETATLRTDDAITANTTNWTGLTTLNVTGAADTVGLTVADTTAVNVSGVELAAAGAVTVTGGSTVTLDGVTLAGSAGDDVTITGDALTSVSVSNTDLGASGDLVITDTSTNADVLQTVTLDTVVASGAAVAITGDITALNVTDTDEDIAITSAAGTRTLTVALDGANTGVITDANATTLVINSSGAGAGNDADGVLVAASAIVAAAAESVSITATDNDAAIGLDVAAATELTVAGDAVVTLTPTDITAVETVTVSGAAGLDADLSTAPVAVFNASATSGDNTVTLDGTEADIAVTGGTGADDVTVTGALDAGAVVDLGDGDDTYTFTTAAAAGAAVDAGAGNDTIAINNGTTLLNAAAADVYSNFEILEIAGGQGTYDMSRLSLTAVTLTDTTLVGAAAITEAAVGTTVAFNVSQDDTGAATVDLTTAGLSFAFADDTATDSLSISLNADDTGTDQTADGQVVAAILADSIETINVESNATTASEESSAGADDALTEADYENQFTLVSDAATDVVLSGGAKVALTIGADDGAAAATTYTVVDFIDASANTAGVTVNVGTVDANTAATNGVSDAVNSVAVTFRGSDAADVYTAGYYGDTIQGNGGADTINLNDGTDDNNGGNLINNGNDTIRYVAASDSQLTLTDTTVPADGTADTATGYDVINGFNAAGTDIIELSSSLGLATGDARSAVLQKGTIPATTVAALEDFIGTGVDFFSTGLVDRAVAFAEDGTDGWVFVDANGDGNFTQADDMVIQLAGVTTFDVTDIQFG